MHIPHTVYPFIRWWTLGLYFWVILQFTLANKYFWSPPFSSFGHTPRNGIAGSWVILGLALCGPTRLFPQWLHHFTLPSAIHGGSNFSISLLTLLFFFIMAILVDVKKYHTVVLSCIFLMISDAEHISICLLVKLVYSLWRNVSSSPFLILKLGCFLFLNCRASWYILNTNLLLDAWFANYFFPFCRVSFYIFDKVLRCIKNFNFDQA